MFDLKLHFFISRSLEREKTFEAERMQALKLIRRMVEVDCKVIPHNLIRSLVSIAEHNEDNFSRIAVETICELSKFNSLIV